MMSTIISIIDDYDIKFNDNIYSFSNYLKEQLLKLKCSCAITKKKSEYWDELRKYLLDYGDDLNSYEVNFSNGFYYWVTKEYQTAYVYLTNAIQLNPLCDISYNLRADIDIKINPDNIKDAYKAVALNPSARNYFVLGTVLEKGNEITEEILSYYIKTAELDCTFYHASTNIATHYRNIKDYDKSLFYLKSAKGYNPQAWGIYEHLGYLYLLMKNYVKSIEHYNIYINRIGDAERIKKGKKVRKIAVNEAWELGIAQLKLKNYDDGISLINICLNGGGYNHFKTTINNLYKKNNENIFNEITTARLKEKMDKGKWVEIDGTTIYQEADCNGFAYIHYKNKQVFNISKLDVHHSDHSIEYLWQFGNQFDRKNIYNVSSISTFDFGKYKNELVIDVIVKDPSYILWCIINLDCFLISELLLIILLNCIDIKKNTNYLDAIEIDLIKLKLVNLYVEMIEEWDEDYEQCRKEQAMEDEIKSYYEDYGLGEGGDNEEIGWQNLD